MICNHEEECDECYDRMHPNIDTIMEQIANLQICGVPDLEKIEQILKNPIICIECNIHNDHKNCEASCECIKYWSNIKNNTLPQPEPGSERHAFVGHEPPSKECQRKWLCHHEDSEGIPCGKPENNPIHKELK